MDGRTLDNFNRKLIDTENFYDIIVKICYALNALHSQDIIHKDLKPTNIKFKILKKSNKVKVMDYGFLKFNVEGEEDTTLDKTLPYVAPEIYLGNEATPQSDFYSLGVILYELTTGTLPFTVDEILSLKKNKRKSLIPKFPREINPDIPLGIENLTMKLLEKNPSDRFNNARNIINYINEIQIKSFPYSYKKSAVNRIRFSDYIVREDYSHEILEYTKLIDKGNGKLILIYGCYGLGKANALSLFRYHILTNKYYIFDYECNAQNRDPFFALIKEFFNALHKREDLQKELQNISEKFTKYLYDSEEKAAKIEETEEELEQDFKTSENFIFKLSELKPIIFIIRSSQYLTKESVDFINFISKKIVDKPILIILSSNNPRLLDKLLHPVAIRFKPLKKIESKEYIENLLDIDNINKDFAAKLWKLAHGNPYFIEQILIDLTEKRKIWYEKQYHFDFDISQYNFPPKIRNPIFTQMTHLSEKNYNYLTKLAFVRTPLSQNLVIHLLDISKKELFYLFKEATANELLYKDDEFYYFTYSVAKEKFLESCNKEEKKQISHKILAYFKDKQITLLSILEQIISHAQHVEDYDSQRFYLHKKASLHINNKRFSKAFLVLADIIELDFSDKIDVPENDLYSDLKQLINMSEWIISDQVPDKLKRITLEMPEIYEKYMLIGLFFKAKENFKLALENLEKAKELSFTRNQRLDALIILAKIYYQQDKIDKFDEYLREIELYNDLSAEYKISYIALKSLFYQKNNEYTKAIEIIEDYLPDIESHNDPNFFIKLGNLHNILALAYHKQRSLENANRNFHKARKIWEKIKYKKKLVTIYNNIGDTALIQGDTKTAFTYFRKAIKICAKVKSATGSILSLLNHAQAFIKLGKFDNALLYLNQAYKKSQRFKNKPFINSIEDNMAIVRSKLKNYNYYFSFIKENVPGLLNDEVYKVTPLTKTFFYFLHNIGYYEKIKSLLESSHNVFFEYKEFEFYYQMLGYIQLQRKEYQKALKSFKQAFEYSKYKKNVYAEAINSVRLTEIFLEIKDIDKALTHLNKAESICEKYNFQYWDKVVRLKRIHINLLKSSINIREILRELQYLLMETEEKEYFLLRIEILSYLVQIYANLKVRNKAKKYFKIYKKSVKDAVKDLPKKFKDKFFEKTKINVRDYRQLKLINIKERRNLDSYEWQDELYRIVRIPEISRIKFLINETIKNLLVPYYYAIVKINQATQELYSFTEYNIKEKELIENSKFRKNISKCIEENKILKRNYQNSHLVFLPLVIKSIKVGCLILADQGELRLLPNELDQLKLLKYHLTSLLIKVEQFSELNKEKDLITKLIKISHNFFNITERNKLEHEIVALTMSFINGSRGFLIKKDKSDNYLYKVAIDDSKHILDQFSHVSKTIIREAQKDNKPIFIENAQKANLYKVYDDSMQNTSIYCVPITVNNEIYGFLYIDNFNRVEHKLHIDKDLITLLLKEINIALKNSIRNDNLAKKNRELNKLNKLKNEFINIVSHELNTPIMNLENSLNKMKKQNKDNEAQKLLMQAKENTNLLHNRITDIINFSRYRMKKELKKQLFDINSILSSTVEKAKQLSESRHMIFKLKTEDDLPQVLINYQAFHIALMNILVNAIRYTDDFGTITVGSRLSSFRNEEIDNEETLIIYIQDNGIGIPQAELDKIFSQFYEITDIYSHKSGTIEFKSSGLGLGLATVKLIIQLHNGKIWITSKEKEGTVVYIALPLAKNFNGENSNQ